MISVTNFGIGIQIFYNFKHFKKTFQWRTLEILGRPDERKLKSCMTLFGLLPDTPEYFGKVLEKYYNGGQDEKTLQILKESGS
ncbi:DUF1810 family protein [Flavobacterium sp. LC2016-01]|nr:DUF1810 family protein [Flavobacterium sp. LC2016-01]